MHCLQICNDFLGSKVHSNLYWGLKKLDVNLTVYHPIRRKIIPVEQIEPFKTDLVLSKRLRKRHKILFRNKIKYLLKDLESKITLKNVDLIHTSTLYSDGAIAFELHKKYKIPYMVAVRSTDVDFYMGVRKDLYSYMVNILNNSFHIVFINHSLRNRFYNNLLLKGVKIEELLNKSSIIPNGIDDFWINNRSENRKSGQATNFLYVGSFLKRKNLEHSINAFLELLKHHPNIKFNLVGGGNKNKTLERIFHNNPLSINQIGKVSDKTELKNIYRANDIFVMPSKYETFGLVYLEALSQGLPVLYAEKEGIDGFIPENAGESCDPNSFDSILASMTKLFNHFHVYDPYSFDIEKFSWKNITEKWHEIYQTAFLKK